MQKGIFAVKLFNVVYIKGKLDINHTENWENTKLILMPTPVGIFIKLDWSITLKGCPGIANTINKIKIDFAVMGLPTTVLVPFINLCPRCIIVTCGTRLYKSEPTADQRFYDSFYKVGKGLTKLIRKWPIEYREDDPSITIILEECNISPDQFDKFEKVLSKYIN